jgi:hypothetical protein
MYIAEIDILIVDNSKLNDRCVELHKLIGQAEREGKNETVLLFSGELNALEHLMDYGIRDGHFRRSVPRPGPWMHVSKTNKSSGK